MGEKHHPAQSWYKSKHREFKATMLFDEYAAMERFQVDEVQFYALPRHVRARMVAYGRIGSFVSLVDQYDHRPKGK